MTTMYVVMFQQQADFDDDWEEAVPVAVFDTEAPASALANLLTNDDAMRVATVEELELNPGAATIDKLITRYNPPVEDDDDLDDDEEPDDIG